MSGLIIYKGRGGSAGWVSPRKPRPLSGAGAAALPLPIADIAIDEMYRIFTADLERRTFASAKPRFRLIPLVSRFGERLYLGKVDGDEDALGLGQQVALGVVELTGCEGLAALRAVEASPERVGRRAAAWAGGT